MTREVVVAALLSLACAGAIAQALDPNVTPEFREWQQRNPWYGADMERTEFARKYMRQLAQERPELQGKALLDEVSRKTRQTFAGKAQKR